MSTEERLERLLGRLGPLTGAELQEQAGGDAFDLWKATTLSSRLEVRSVATRYLRLDRKVDGFARLSPSILREFLTYSVVGRAGDTAALERRAAEVLARIHAVSRAKLDLAAGVAAGLTAGEAAGAADGRASGSGAGSADGLATAPEPEARFCVFIAGDVVYDMAHDVPRPERSTGKLVRGSDLDLVVIVDDAAPEALLQRLDDAVYRQKYRHLINPSAREEIDYIVKRFERLREQATFDGFKQMVACKILQEGVFLHGSRALFDAAKALLDEYGVTQKLTALETAAARHRRDAEWALLGTERDILSEDVRRLFYTTEESEEFE